MPKIIKEEDYQMDYLDTSADNATEDMILEYLARIISDIYRKGEYTPTDKGKDTKLSKEIDRVLFKKKL